MGRKCAVPHCYTGYRKCKDKASLYRVPDDDFFLNKWQEAIAREDRPITPKDYVCEKHFKDDDILRSRTIKDVVEVYQRPRLRQDAIPSIFPDLPEFILKMVKKRRKIVVQTEQREITSSDQSINTSHNTSQENNLYIHNDNICNDENIKIKDEPLENTGNPPEDISTIISNNEIEIKCEIEDLAETSTEKEKDDVNGQKIHHCDECLYKTKYPHNLRTHKTKHLTGEKAYIHCKHCPKFKTKWELTYRNHLKIKHGIGKQEKFKCNLCHFETKVKLCLKRHYDRHNKDTEDKNYKCEHPGCEYEVESKALLKIHTLVHKYGDYDDTTEKQKSYRCTECLYETNSKTHILKHIKTTHNTGDDTVVSVNTKTTITSEEKNTETKRKSIYTCKQCSYKTHFRTLLLKHIFKHKFTKTDSKITQNSKVWKCPKCSFATFFKQTLNRHQETECERNNYKCDECSFITDARTDYVKHTLTHRNTSIEVIRRNKKNVDMNMTEIGSEMESQHLNEDVQKILEFDMITVKEEFCPD